MKRFALTAFAALFTAGTLTAPALAESSYEVEVDTQIVQIDRTGGALKLANGMTLDQNVEWFAMPVGAAPGDKVRITYSDSNDLKSVRVIR